ncbi:MAG: hypothetical protein ABJB66_12105 [Gemmatimonadaceae bacterium]
MNRFRLVPIFFAALLACESTSPLVARTNEPIFSLILSPDAPVAPQTELRALLATTATPIQLQLRTANEFRLTRASDGALFSWRQVVVDTPYFNGRPSLFSPFNGNYALAERAEQNGLGRLDLRPGDTYLLRVVSEGRTITGSTRIPLRPTLSIAQRGTDQVVVWRSQPGVTLYLVQGLSVSISGMTLDTFAVIPSSNPDGPNRFTVRVSAADNNYARFMLDQSVMQSGIDGAYGLLGAVNSAEIEVQMKSSARSQPPKLAAPNR